MDNNVSRDTFISEFFRERFTGKNLAIKELLKQVLLRTIDSYLTINDIKLNLKFISDVFDSKIVLLQDYSRALSAKNQFDDGFLKSKLTNIVYRCAIAFPLANFCRLPVQNVAIGLVNLFPLVAHTVNQEPHLELIAKIITPGWIDFYLSQTSLANWLKQLPIFLTENLSSLPSKKLASLTQNLFPLQYTHARCCALLRLGEREKLIQLRDRDFNSPLWHLTHPNSVLWLDDHGQSEYQLLLPLLATIDFLASDSGNWLKIGTNLSQAMLTFDAQCPIFGETNRLNPHKAISRLGLVALAQYCLQNLLEKKIGVKAIAYL